MSTVYPKLPRLAVRDSFDEEDMSDADEEVFIRDGKSGILKVDEDCSVKRPLMAPRRKCKTTHCPETSQLSYKTLFAPFCYVLIAFVVLLGLIVLCIVTANKFPMPLNLLRNWLSQDVSEDFNTSNVVPCTSLGSKVVWARTLPKFTSEAPLRSNDVNGDSIQDIIVGFSTGLDKADTADYVCTVYFDRPAPCLGGILALDGNSGATIWIHWTAHAIFSIDCELDLTGDEVKDCIIAGRGGILHAVNGRDGSTIWEMSQRDLTMRNRQKYFDIYDAKYIADIDDDGVGDIIASHTQQSDGTPSEIVLISGKSGNTIHSEDLPGSEQLFTAPQILVHPDGENYLLLATNSEHEHKSGGLYAIPQSKFLHGEFKLHPLHHGPGKGILLPLVLVDINSDGTEDIIAAMFNSTIVAYDGLTFKEIWNFTIPDSEVISIPIPGYFDEDDVPDFMVKHQIGPGFPVYRYTTATVLSGKTGKPLLDKPMEDSLSAQMAGLSVSVDGFNNDWFLHWSADCLNYAGAKDNYEFVDKPSTDANLCKLRFNSTLVTTLFAFSQHVEPPGIPIYYSEDWKRLEYNNSIDPRKEAEDFADSHSLINNDQEADISSMSNRSPKLQKNHHKSSLRHKVENGVLSESSNYYPKIKNNKFDTADEYRPNEDLLNKALDEFSDDDEWKDLRWENEKPKKSNFETEESYDDLYDDDEEERILEPPQLNEIRALRSDTSNVRTVNNDTNDVKNQLDPSMDYTNGQSKQNSYYSLLPYNRSSNIEESADYMNIPDIDFVDNIKDAEALDDMRKREIEETTEDTFTKHMENSTLIDGNMNSTSAMNESKDDSWVLTSSFAQLVRSEEDANIEKVFKRESMKNLKNKPSEKKPYVFLKLINEFRTKKLVSKREQRVESKEESEKVPSGTQRQPQTGILLPSLKPLEKRNSIDLVFSTYWLPPSQIPFVLLPRDLECIRKTEKLSGRKLESKEREAVISDCLMERGINYEIYQEAMDKENVKISLGQMTVYRMQLECVCPEDMLPSRTCKDISHRQSWPSYLGASGNGYFAPVNA